MIPPATDWFTVEVWPDADCNDSAEMVEGHVVDVVKVDDKFHLVVVLDV